MAERGLCSKTCYRGRLAKSEWTHYVRSADDLADYKHILPSLWICWRRLYPIILVLACDIGQQLDMNAAFTPTVGLGCRSGGYFVYMIIVVGLICIEMIVWCFTHETTHTPGPIVESVLDSNVISAGETRFPSVDYRSDCTTPTFRDLMKNLIIRPCEIFNTGWLAYIILCAGLWGVSDMRLYGEFVGRQWSKAF